MASFPGSKVGVVSWKQGKYDKAEGLYKRVLEIAEKTPNLTDAFGTPDLISPLTNLAVLYRSEGRYAEAEGLWKRVLAIEEKVAGKDSPDAAIPLGELVRVYRNQGRYDEAEELAKRALAIKERTQLVISPNNVAMATSNLAQVYLAQSRYADAEGLFKRALAMQEQIHGKSHTYVADNVDDLALVYQGQGRYDDAEGLFKRALAIHEQVEGPSHPAVAETLNQLAILYGATGNTRDALIFSRKATAAVTAHAGVETAGIRQNEKTGDLVEGRANYFLRLVTNIAAAAQKGIEPAPALSCEAFETAQLAVASSAATAVQQMGLRFAAGGDVMASLVRENQDLSVFWRERDKALIEALSKSEGQRNQTVIDNIRKQIADTERRFVAIAARLEKDFPEYAALASPKPLKAEEVQQLLRPDEALVFFLAADKESYVFALTREGFDRRTIPVGANELAGKVAAFRRGLDVDEWEKARYAGKPVMFDLGLAHKLYVTLLEPVEALVSDKRHLLVVPTGALTALPFHLLVTEKPSATVPGINDTAPYRDAKWLLKRHAISVLPSVASMRALRVFAQKDKGTKPMIGFGDPVFNPDDEATTGGQRSASARTVSKTRAFTDFWQGVGVDRAMLSKALPRLEDTADELKAVAKKLDAPATDIHLRADASETMVKRAPFADYRVVYFATHGLVAGDIKGLGEPSLALSIPPQPSDFDDGLLTASEVAQLKLNADWIVLSACNTIAGDKPGAEALSGLARAFFYAGARALLVTHWPVASDAATRLTISTFEAIKSDASIGRAEALRRAMLAYLNDTSDLLNAYPAFWGPFELVGDGSGR